MLPNCSDILVLGTCWKTWYSMVSEQTCTINHQMANAWIDWFQYCHVGNTAKQRRLGLFQDSDFAGDLEDLKSTSGGTLCIFGSHTFVPISWMCKKQTAVSHSSAESEIISLDAGLRLGGLLALELWDLIVSVFGSVIQTSDGTGRLVDTERSQKSQGKINVLKNVDCVPWNVQSSRQEALLYVFEDNVAVIKMIIEGRSPTMRHVSRTHRVALDLLLDWINLDSKIQIKYIDTKNQFADISTWGNFTRDKWNHWLCLFNFSHFSSAVCSDTMAKRSQPDSGGERVTAKSRPMMNLIARTPSHVSSSTSVSPGKKSHGSQDPLSSMAKKEERSVRLDIGVDRLKASDYYHHEQSPQSSLPGHRRKRPKYNHCVSCEHSSSATSSFNNLMVSSMTSLCSRLAQRRHSAVWWCRGWRTSPPLSRLMTVWWSTKVETWLSRKHQNKHAAGCPCESPQLIPFLLLVHSSGRLRHHNNEFIATETCVFCENTTKLASEQRRRRYRGWQTPTTGDFWSKMITRNKATPKNKNTWRKNGRHAHSCDSRLSRRK